MSVVVGIDPGIATLGWALADMNGRVLGLGVSILPRNKQRGAREDLMWRCQQQSNVIREVATDASRVCSEAVSWGMPGSTAMAMIASAAAITIAVCDGISVPLQFVSPQKWQSAVLPARSFKSRGDKAAQKSAAEQRYKSIYNALAGHVIASGERAALETIKPAHRNHALDAVGLAVYGALHWEGPCK